MKLRHGWDASASITWPGTLKEACKPSRHDPTLSAAASDWTQRPLPRNSSRLTRRLYLTCARQEREKPSASRTACTFLSTTSANGCWKCLKEKGWLYSAPADTGLLSARASSGCMVLTTCLTLRVGSTPGRPADYPSPPECRAGACPGQAM